MAIGSCHTYFELGNGLTAGDSESGVKSFVLNFGDGDVATTITTITTTDFTNPTDEAAAWYTLDGRRMTGKPAVRGIYVTGSRKVIVK